MRDRGRFLLFTDWGVLHAFQSRSYSVRTRFRLSSGPRTVTVLGENMRSLIIGVAAACALALAGCNTISGAGKDIERGGEKIQDASLKARAAWRADRDKHERDYDAAR